MSKRSNIGLALIIAGGLILLIGAISFINNPDISLITSILPKPTPYVFSVTRTSQKFHPFPDRSPVGTWIVSVPGDNKIYDSGITVGDKNMVCVNFVKGKAGIAAFMVKERAWTVDTNLGPTAWWETNFYKSGKTSLWNTRINESENLKFQAQENVDFIVEMYKR